MTGRARPFAAGGEVVPLPRSRPSDPPDASEPAAGDSNKSDAEALSPLVGVLARLVEALERPAASDPDVMTLEDVAQALECSVDTLRRIPQAKLPAYRVGKVNLYFREDMLRYVRSRPADRTAPRANSSNDGGGGSAGDDIDARLDDMLKSSGINTRKPSERRAR